MSDYEESTLPEGFFLKPPHEAAPSWIKGQIGIKVDTAIEYLQRMKNDKGYVNLDLKESKGGKLYLDLNNFIPKPPEERTAGPVAPEPVVDEESDPF